MIQIILVLTILQICYYYIFKPKLNTLNCGIFGQITNTPGRINSANIKILGMFNESRGKNSCGITIDGEIYHGLDKEKLFTDFMKGKQFKPKQFPIIIGHTRTASVGAINSFNSHPFGYGENKINKGYKLILTHNGTLYNHKELAKKYNISETEEYPSTYNKDTMAIRYKGDSEILGEILYKTKNFRVLSEYNGRAALAWTDTDKPNVMYLWSGKSVPDEGDAPEKAVEERPMNVYVESKNNCYFSSLPESLYAIGGTDKNVFQIDYNTVYIITDGDFKHAKTIRISRKDNYHTETYTYNRGNYNYKTPNSVTYDNDAWSEDYYPRQHSAFDLNKNKPVINLPASNLDKPVTYNNIYYDTMKHYQNWYAGKVYSKQLRYYKNGHLIDGIYTFIPEYGLYFMGNTIKKCHLKLFFRFLNIFL